MQTDSFNTPYQFHQPKSGASGFKSSRIAIKISSAQSAPSVKFSGSNKHLTWNYGDYGNFSCSLAHLLACSLYFLLGIMEIKFNKDAQDLQDLIHSR
jgi:hypothetical protein